MAFWEGSEAVVAQRLKNAKDQRSKDWQHVIPLIPLAFYERLY